MDGWNVSLLLDFLPKLAILILFLFLVVPSFAIDEKTRTQAFDAAIGFLREAHREHGWDWDES